MALRYYLDLINPVFLYRKRRGIKNRIREMPDDLIWWLAHKLISRGYVQSDVEDIKKLHGVFDQKKCVLVGNGPSVRIEDLDRLATAGLPTFGCNRLHLAYSETVFRPSYIISSDEQVIGDFGMEIAEQNQSNVVFVSKVNPKIESSFWVRLKKSRRFVFSEDPCNFVAANGGSLIAAIQLAYYFGAREMYLYGVDHSFTFTKAKGGDGRSNAIGEGNHFIKDYRSGRMWQAPNYRLVEDAFRQADVYLRSKGGGLFNATRGGELEVLERVNFDDVFDN